MKEPPIQTDEFLQAIGSKNQRKMSREWPMAWNNAGDLVEITFITFKNKFINSLNFP